MYSNYSSIKEILINKYFNQMINKDTINYCSFWVMLFCALIGYYYLSLIFLIVIEVCSRFSHTRYLLHRINFFRIKMSSEEKEDAKSDIIYSIAIILNFLVCVSLLNIIPKEINYFIPRFIVGATMIIIFIKTVNKWLITRGFI